MLDSSGVPPASTGDRAVARVFGLPLPALSLGGAITAFIGSFASWGHVTVPLLGSTIWTGVDIAGPLLPVVAAAAVCCACVQIAGVEPRVTSRIGAALGALLVLVVAYGTIITAGQYLLLLREMASPDPWVSAGARLTSFGVDAGLLLAATGSVASLFATVAAAAQHRH